MKRVIITADDLGKSEAVNRGIEQGYLEGLITSTSLLVNGEAWEDALKVIERVPNLDIGLHLNLIEGRPISSPKDIPTIVYSKGIFFQSYRTFLRKFYQKKIARADLEKEIRAQIEQFLEVRGIITHLDSHKHIHLLPEIWRLLIQLSQEYPIKALRLPAECFMPGLLKKASLRGLAKVCLLRLLAWRMRKEAEKSQIKIPDHFVGIMHSGKITSPILKIIFRSLRNGITEIMTHPAIENDPTRKGYFMKEELEALTDDFAKTQTKERSIELISFRDWVFESY
jgi:hopanoid biosynthesis associated protein HpnK